MSRLVVLLFVLMPSISIANGLVVTPIDHWNTTFECDVPTNDSTSLRARTTIVQPCGFTQVVETSVNRDGTKAQWQLDYPLVDEGRFEVQPGTWTGYWDMGKYHFRAELIDGGETIHEAETTFDPMSACQRDNYGPIFSSYPHQFIECSPLRPAYIDEDHMGFSIRTLPERVVSCIAVVDVTSRDDDRVLAGPWNFELSGTPIKQSFDSGGWPRGEYWIRIRLHKNGTPVGPYIIRKVWKEILPEIEGSSIAYKVDRGKPMLASTFAIGELAGCRLLVNPPDKKPARALFVMDKPWETELLYYKTLHYDTDDNEYVLEYELAGGDKSREAERAELPTTLCRATSTDGLTWVKPSLGLVSYRGSTDNNLLPADQRYVPPRPADAAASLSHDLQNATFRFYEAEADGPVNLPNVFVSAVKNSFANECPHPSSHPFRTGAWPMEKRGNEYLVLTREPILFLGVGMDLYHSTEKICLHVEDKKTGKLYYFFRPGSPSYPPHHAPYDNMHMARRCLGVMWTSDGINWERRLIAVPDELDAPATQFYYNTIYNAARESSVGRPAIALEDHWNKAAVDGIASTMACLTIFDAKANQLWPELATITDLLHWDRLEPRQKLIANGPEGSYDHGLIKIESHYHFFNGEWWFPYQAINTLHQDYIGLARMSDVEQLKREFPNYSQMPGFENWEQYWKRCKSMRYYTGMARCLPGRLCHIEPIDNAGTVTTDLIMLDGDKLLVNAAVDVNGSLRVEAVDPSGAPVPGFGLQSCQAVTGNGADLEVAWNGAELPDLNGREIKLRFHLDRAKLYGYHTN